jgi:hypothetical protein
MDDDETGTNYTVITGKPQAKTKIKPVIKKKQQLDEETVDVDVDVDVEVVTNDADADAEAAPINLKFIDMEEALSSRLSMIRRKKNSVS